jgi:hypothetical protein
MLLEIDDYDKRVETGSERPPAHETTTTHVVSDGIALADVDIEPGLLSPRTSPHRPQHTVSSPTTLNRPK